MYKKLHDSIGEHLTMLQTKLVPVLNSDELEEAEADLKAARSAKEKRPKTIALLESEVARLRAVAEDTSSPFIKHKSELGSIFSQMKALHDSMNELGFYTNASKRGRQAGTRVATTAKTGTKRAYTRRTK